MSLRFRIRLELIRSPPEKKTKQNKKKQKKKKTNKQKKNNNNTLILCYPQSAQLKVRSDYAGTQFEPSLKIHFSRYFSDRDVYIMTLTINLYHALGFQQTTNSCYFFLIFPRK